MIEKVNCPNCDWKPDSEKLWHCLECGDDMDMFENLGRCDHCSYNHDRTYCPVEYGGCGESTAHLAWYGEFDDGLKKLNIIRE